MDTDNEGNNILKKKRVQKWVTSSFVDFDLSCKPPPKLTNSKAVSLGVESPPKQTFLKKKNASECQISVHSYVVNSSRKRQREPVHRLTNHIQAQSSQSLRSTFNSDLWSEKYKPESQSELALHKKKVDEICEWLKDKSKAVQKHAAPILLLTGPPGAGKTACIHVLASELGLSVHEWSNSAGQSSDQWSEDIKVQGLERSRVDVYSSQSQSTQFQNFLLRANKYHALDLFQSSSTERPSTNKGNNCVIMVEDLPNAFHKDSVQFHDILRKYRYAGHCPLIFIQTESNSNSSSILKLFPKDLQFQLHIMHISVNPVAPTVLVKLLNKVLAKESRLSQFAIPSVSVVETVAMSSGGDVRSALNALQFACKRDTLDLNALCSSSRTTLCRKGSGPRLKYGSMKGNKKQNTPTEEPSLTIGAKDMSVFLFQAVGKILYFKREESNGSPNLPVLPDHLKHFDRDPLLIKPEEVILKSHVSGDYFNSFLHENYVEFLSSVEDLERAAQYFSDSDFVAAQWMGRDELQQYSVSIASRGFIHSNSDVIRHDSIRKGHGWRPLHKSQWFSANKRASENVETARQLFKGYHWEPELLCTEVMPYLSLVNPTLHDTGQISFVQEMTQFSHYRAAKGPEKLDEKDVIEGEDAEDDLNANHTEVQSQAECQEKGQTGADQMDKDIISNSQSHIIVTKEEEEFVIEEFDD